MMRMSACILLSIWERALNGPQERQKTAQGETPVPGQGLGPPEADVVKKQAVGCLGPPTLHFLQRGPLCLDDFPGGGFSSWGRFLTVPGSGNGFRRQKTMNNRPLQCFFGVSVI